MDNFQSSNHRSGSREKELCIVKGNDAARSGFTNVSCTDVWGQGRGMRKFVLVGQSCVCGGMGGLIRLPHVKTAQTPCGVLIKNFVFDLVTTTNW